MIFIKHLEYISDLDDGEYVLDQNKGKSLQIACNCNKTQDGQNHFWLLKAKISQE